MTKIHITIDRAARPIFPEQLELFAVIALPPCGRGLGACEAFVEADHLRCIQCGCIAPLPRTPQITTP